jgi:hypothetical protein
MDAIFRIQPDRRLKPNSSHLSGQGHVNLITRFGHLDLLCTIGDGFSYEQLLPYSESWIWTKAFPSGYCLWRS